MTRSSWKGRVISLTGRSRTPRRCQTPLASEPRGDGHGSVRLLSSLPAESGKTDGSCEWRTVLGWFRAETPPVVQCVDTLKGDYYIGRGCRQRGLPRSVFGNPHKAPVYGRTHATPSSQSTGISCRTPTTATVPTHMFFPRQFSTFFHVSVRSETRQTDRLRTKQDHRRQLDGEEQESRWKSDWGTRPGRSATDKDGPRQEDGLRNAATRTRHCGRQPRIRSWTSRRPGTTALLTRLARRQVTESPFEEEAVTRLREQVVRALAEKGLHLNRHHKTGKARRRIQRLPSVTSLEESVSDPAHGFRERSGASRNNTTAQTISRQSMTRKQRGGRTTHRSSRVWRGRPVLKRSSAEAHGNGSKRTVSRLSRRFAGGRQKRRARGCRHRPGLV